MPQPNFDAGQAERVAHHPQQRRIGLDIELPLDAVDPEFCHREILLELAVFPRLPFGGGGLRKRRMTTAHSSSRGAERIFDAIDKAGA